MTEEIASSPSKTSLETPTSAIRIPRVALVGAEGMVGASTVQLGLLVALKGSGIEVSGGKIGPDLVAPTLHRRVTKRFAHTFDPWLLNKDQLIATLAQAASGSELLLLEGSGGVFDLCRSQGQPIKQTDLVRRMSMPLIVVIDGRGYQKNISAVVGAFDRKDSQIAGIIVNRADASHEAHIARAIRSLGGPRYLGSLPEQADQEFVGRPSVVMEGIPTVTTRNQLIRLGQFVEEHLDISELRALASEAPLLDLREQVYESAPLTCRIAVADDQAFHLTVQDNLELLRRSGAQLVYFSPLADTHLPDNIQGIYLPGGFIEQYVDLINANPYFIEALRTYVIGGGLLYAEGDAVAYLCEEVEFASGKKTTMTGILPAIARQKVSAEENHYGMVTMLAPSILGEAGRRIRAIQRSIWAIEKSTELSSKFRLEQLPVSMYMSTSQSSLRIEDGFSPMPRVLATAAHLHWASCPEVAQSFVAAAQKV